MTNFTNQAFTLQPPPTSSTSWMSFPYALIASWMYGWLTSGCAAESFLLLTGPAEHWSVSRYTLLAALNAAYLLASTSWLFYLAFAAVCWPLVVVTCIVQYATVSSFARNRLRSWLKYMHFYRDKVAFFYLPSLVIDTDLDGLVTIRGITFSILDLTIELHGIEVGMDLGSGHELSIHSDAVTIKLFRQIAIDEVYGVHWFTGDSPNPEGRVHRADSHRDSHSDETHSPQSKKDLIKEKFFPSVEESSAASQRDYVKDRILPRSEDERHYSESDVNSANVSGARRPSRGDVEAEQRYDDVLLGLRQSNRLYQSRARVRISHGNGKDQTDESPDTQAAVCADLRSTRPPMSEPSGRIPVSKLIEVFEPITRLIDKVPSLLRVTLWLLSQSHPVTCPSICFSACGAYLGDELLNKLFRRHAADDKRIADLKKQVTDWLSAADIYLDFACLRGRGSVPLRTTNDIRVELSSADVIITRVNPHCETQPSKEADDNTGRVAWLKGIDTSFTIPTCLLPSHAYLAPLPEKSSSTDKADSDDDNDNNDTAPVAIAIRGHLPAHFSDPFLSFAATLSKTTQMLDIEEEAGLATDDTNSPVPRSERLDQEHRDGSTSDSKTGHSHNNHFQGFRAKIAHGRIGAAIKHPVVHGKHLLHKEVKKTAVDKVDGAWFAKWTNKLLRQLEWLDGDLGYSMEVPTPIKRWRVRRGGVGG